MWKDSASAAIPGDRLLNMGPIWDFDISAGNMNAADNWRPQGCWVDISRVANPALPTLYVDLLPNWYTKLRDNHEFVDLVTARWKGKRAALGRLTDASIATYERRLEAAAARNFARWPLLGERLFLDEFTFRTWPEHVANLKTFLDQRLAWMDQAFASPADFAVMCQ
jgi:hypothetical protein